MIGDRKKLLKLRDETGVNYLDANEIDKVIKINLSVVEALLTCNIDEELLLEINKLNAVTALLERQQKQLNFKKVKK
ncbi:MAG: hypothetical protein RSA10_03250 [Bacilli bacterium]